MNKYSKYSSGVETETVHVAPAFKNLTIKIDESEVEDKREVKDMSLKTVSQSVQSLSRV